MNTKGLHTKALSNDIHSNSFSFSNAGSSSQLTPNLVASNSQGTTNKNDKGGEAANRKLQSKESSCKKQKQSDMEVQI